MANNNMLPSTIHGSSLPSISFHGTSLLSRFEAAHLRPAHQGFKITCSLPPPPTGPPPRAPIATRHFSSHLASSLHMHTPQGEALLAMTSQRLPLALISQAASEQLQLLAAAAAETTSSSEYQEGVLSRRIADMKDKEMKMALEDILLALATHRLMLAISDQFPTLQNATLAQQDTLLDDGLQTVHPPDLQPLIERHVAIVINGKDHAELPLQPGALARVRKLEMGKMYAASVMHGYFLARVHQRFKLERVLQLEAVSMQPRMQRDGFVGGLHLEVVSMEPYLQIKGSTGMQSEPVSMEAYMQVAEGGKEAFRDMNSIRCFHTIEVIERHCRALFGDANTITSPSILTIQLGYVRSLILQALAFGALLREVENNLVSHSYSFL